MSQEHDKIIKLVQSSTRTILSNYRERAELLRGCSEDVKLLIREGHNPEIAKNTAERLWYTRQYLLSSHRWYKKPGRGPRDDNLLCWRFWIHRKTDFTDKRGCSYNEPIAVKGTLSISTAIPVQEENISAVAGQLKEGVIDIDAERVPCGLMHLAEYYNDRL